jgi:hypothetical protein
MKYALGVFKKVGVGLGLIMFLAAAFAQPASSETETLSERTAEWWQWALSIPTAVNPLINDSGANCMVGQRGSVWFLAGLFNGASPPAVRTCSVPDTATLFFPVINSIYVDTPNACGQVAALSVKEMRAQAAPFVDGASKLSVTVDSQPVAAKRVQSIVFDVALPGDNLFNAPCLAAPRIYPRSVDDGFYVLLHPLNVGNHTLHIHAENTSQNFVLDVTYYLNVVETPETPSE